MSALAAGAFDVPARFRLVRKIGAGGMGVVYEAFDRERDLRVALKHLAEPSSATLYLFKREFHALAGIVHPNLVALHELISDGQHWFFTMELIDEGVDFLSHVTGTAQTGAGAAGSDGAGAAATEVAAPISAVAITTMETPHARAVNGHATAHAAPVVPPWHVDHDHLRAAFVQLATGVSALHRAGKLHRDLKPSNAMVRKDGRVVLVDFGLVVELDSHTQDSPARPSRSARLPAVTDSHLAGSIAYMAPEQAAGHPLSEASDWYAVGVMLFEALTGRLPIEGDPLVMWNAKQVVDAPAPSQVAGNVPPELDALCVELLRRDPEARPTGAQVLARLGGTARTRDE
ncbi:MAG TPA: serine/threonine-protein kinase, partial [Kofleriaceae bacterium]|nr:serine/threonine-protein kinase [Kofleriaceae bacterium]